MPDPDNRPRHPLDWTSIHTFVASLRALPPDKLKYVPGNIAARIRGRMVQDYLHAHLASGRPLL